MTTSQNVGCFLRLPPGQLLRILSDGELQRIFFWGGEGVKIHDFWILGGKKIFISKFFFGGGGVVQKNDYQIWGSLLR